MHKSGFVNIIGQPNVGKSTLMNALVGEKMSIITHKPQTTRHRIVGILSADDYQIVFSDTPGMIKEVSYKMQHAMNKFAYSTFEDADIMLFVTEQGERYADEDPIFEKLKKATSPLFLVINKIDTSGVEASNKLAAWWSNRVTFTEIIFISALKKQNTEGLLAKIVERLPESPAYYPKDQLTDRPERFFVAEIIREKILLLYEQEIPYSCQVNIDEFKETKTNTGEPLVRISSTIYVDRKTQKAILIGKDGSAMKKLGTAARMDLETWLESKVFLEMNVKIRENWRNDERMMKYFGYEG